MKIPLQQALCQSSVLDMNFRVAAAVALSEEKMLLENHFKVQ